MNPAELIARWSEPREISTKRGPRLLRTAQPTDAFWEAWRQNPHALTAVGMAVSEWPTGSGQWRVSWFSDVQPQDAQDHQRRAIASAATSFTADIPRPEGLDYLPFQKAGIAFALTAGNCLIADEMGLGKTVQAIGVINATQSIRKVLVVAKSKLKLNWEHELRKWLVKPLSISIADGDDWPEADVLIVNYDILHRRPDRLAERWDLCIADEIQMCKNPSTRRSKALFGERGCGGVNARTKIALSGSPIENRPIELHPILKWLRPDYPAWSSKFAFAKRFCGAYHNGFGWDFSGASNLAELRRILRQTVMVRRLKSDVLSQLPPKRRIVIPLPADGDLSRALERESAFLSTCHDQLARASADLTLAKAGSIAELEMQVHRLATLNRVIFAEMSKLRLETALAKLPAVIELIREDIEEIGPKLVIWAHHHAVVDALRNAFPSALVVTGRSSAEDANAARDQFQSDAHAGPFIGSIRAAGEGITLTAASHEAFVELDWTPGKMLQAEDRCHRIGQSESVTVKYYVVNGSLDARILDTLLRKMKIIEMGLDKGEDVSAEARFPVLPTAHDSPRRKELEAIAATITPDQISAIHASLKTLSSACDGARARDNSGVSKADMLIGHSLANSHCLTPLQAALGLTLVNKYKRQLQ